MKVHQTTASGHGGLAAFEWQSCPTGEQMDEDSSMPPLTHPYPEHATPKRDVVYPPAVDGTETIQTRRSYKSFQSYPI